LLVAFPESRALWNVPNQLWHLDFPALRSQPGLTAVRLFTCLAELSHGGGGTLFVAGSHRLVENLVRERRVDQLRSAEARKGMIVASSWIKALCSRDDKNDRIERFMKHGSTVNDIELIVVEMTGEPGDVFLTHPWLLHAPSMNCSSVPRMVLSSTIFRNGVPPMKIYE